MFNCSRIQNLRKRHFMLQGLPDCIRIPAMGQRREVAAKPIEEATLDDLAFAIGAVESEFNAVGDRLQAIRKLYSLARQAGALGSDRAVNAVASNAGGQ